MRALTQQDWQTLFTAWEHWWTRSGTPHTMAIVRIVVAAFVLTFWLLKAPYVPTLFSSEGIVTPEYHMIWQWAQFLYERPPVDVAWGIYCTLIASLLFVLIGYKTRIAAFVAFVLYHYYFQMSLHLFHTSFDRLYMFTLLLFVIGGTDYAFSLRMKLEKGSWLAWKHMESVLVHRLLAVQITATYWGVGWQKLWLPGWQGGEMLWYTWQGMWATPPAFWLVSHGWSNWYHVLVNVVKIWFTFVFIGFWIRWKNVRFFAVGSAAMFHTLNTLMLGMWWFMYLIPAYALFFEPEDMTKLLKKWKVVKG